MSFKRQILKKYLGEDVIFHIISHHWWVYIRIILFYVVFLMLWFGLYYLVCDITCNLVIRYLFWLYWLILYLKFVVDFLDLYLDSIILTKQGINVFLWDGILKYSNEAMERTSIEAVYDEQEWLLDMLLNKGSIKIKRIDADYVFKDVYNPPLLSSLIMETKERMLSEKQDSEEKESQSIDKFELLVEALGEIIKEYYNKK